jgi:hypothetical protein
MSSAARRTQTLLPWWQLALLLAACGLGVWSLVPGDAQLVENLLRDRSAAEARRAWKKFPPRNAPPTRPTIGCWTCRLTAWSTR